MGGAPPGLRQPNANGCGSEGERGLAKGENSRRGKERLESGWGGVGWGGWRSEDSQAVEQVKAKTT